jgi:hypothetical protein
MCVCVQRQCGVHRERERERERIGAVNLRGFACDNKSMGPTY